MVENLDIYLDDLRQVLIKDFFLIEQEDGFDMTISPNLEFFASDFDKFLDLAKQKNIKELFLNKNFCEIDYKNYLNKLQNIVLSFAHDGLVYSCYISADWIDDLENFFEPVSYEEERKILPGIAEEIKKYCVNENKYYLTKFHLRDLLNDKPKLSQEAEDEIFEEVSIFLEKMKKEKDREKIDEEEKLLPVIIKDAITWCQENKFTKFRLRKEYERFMTLRDYEVSPFMEGQIVEKVQNHLKKESE